MVWFGWYGWYDLEWFGMFWYSLVWRGGQMTSEFIHEEISIMDYNGLSWTIRGGVMTGMDLAS